MRRPLAAAMLAVASCAVLAQSAPAQVYERLRVEARNIVERFERTLTARLRAKMRAGDINDMLGVFDREAAGIAAQLTGETGWRVSWTSLDIRNPENAADAREARILRAFEALAGETVRPHAMEYVATVADDFGERQIHYMQAIPADDVCLTCHGRDIPPEIADELEQRYPEDHATGFKPGELRGAYSLYKRIE